MEGSGGYEGLRERKDYEVEVFSKIEAMEQHDCTDNLTTNTKCLVKKIRACHASDTMARMGKPKNLCFTLP